MRGLGAVLCFLCCLLFTAIALGQSSATSISFQGALNGADGKPLPNGSYTLVFRFYDSPTADSWLYGTTNQGVVVAGGVASTAIAVDPTIFDGTTLYLGITVPDFNRGQELTPRLLVTAVPYAMRAKTAGDERGILDVAGLNADNTIISGSRDPHDAAFNVRCFERGIPINDYLATGYSAELKKALACPWNPTYGIGFVEGSSAIGSTTVWFCRSGGNSAFQVYGVGGQTTVGVGWAGAGLIGPGF